jgi:hypothetical protein
MLSHPENSETGFKLPAGDSAGKTPEKKAYSPPSLAIFGDVRALTMAGGGSGGECLNNGNSGAKKKC